MAFIIGQCKAGCESNHCLREVERLTIPVSIHDTLCFHHPAPSAPVFLRLSEKMVTSVLSLDSLNLYIVYIRFKGMSSIFFF